VLVWPYRSSRSRSSSLTSTSLSPHQDNTHVFVRFKREEHSLAVLEELQVDEADTG
jgi:hypothetical protein